MRQVRGGPEINRKLLIIAITIIAVVIADQVTKVIMYGAISPYETISVVDGLFNLVNVKNYGAAFSLFSNGGSYRSFFLIAVSFMALIIIGVLLRQSIGLWAAFGLSLIAGGALGNLIDRVRLGFVIDFLDVFYRDYHWPAFNVADSAITVGVFIAFVSMYLSDRKQKG